MLQFEVQNETRSIIKVIGVGGGGSNAVNHMFRQGIQGVEFIVCNTDFQDLQKSPVTNKIQLGNNLTRGLGAGAKPEMGRDSAIEAIDEIRRQLNDGTQMVFITAGLGGGTGTGAAPVIASVARELGILTVGIVTMPFTIEGKKRCMQAASGLEEMKKYVDTLLVIGNDKLREIYGNQKLSEAFVQADNVLLGAAKAIAEIISINLHINVDFNDVKTVMKDSGVAIMGSAACSGEHRALRAVENALNSPLLNDNNIKGARHVLLNIMSGSDDITMDEFGEITDYIQEESGYTAELITGYGIDPNLGDNVSVTIIATGFGQNETGYEAAKQNERVISLLTPEVTPVQTTIPVNTIVPEKIEELVQPEAKKTEEPFIILKSEEAKTSEIEKKTEHSSTEIVLKQNEITPTQETSQSSETVLKSEEKSEAEFVIINKTEEINPPVITETNITPSQEIKIEKKENTEFNQVVSDYLNIGSTTKSLEELEHDDKIRLAQERIKKLKELSLKIKTPEGLSMLEKEPTFKRKNTQLDDTNYSTESNVSRYTLSEGDGKVEIKPNNSFLHDNVD
jgi:cell division protein FtsZ